MVQFINLTNANVEQRESLVRFSELLYVYNTELLREMNPKNRIRNTQH